MAEGGIVAEAAPSAPVNPYNPIRVDLSQKVADPGESATPEQRESFALQTRVREIVEEAGQSQIEELLTLKLRSQKWDYNLEESQQLMRGFKRN